MNASSNVIHIPAAEQNQTSSLSTDTILNVLFGVLGLLVAILTAVWTARNGSFRKKSTQGIFVPAS